MNTTLKLIVNILQGKLSAPEETTVTLEHEVTKAPEEIRKTAFDAAVRKVLKAQISKDIEEALVALCYTD